MIRIRATLPDGQTFEGPIQGNGGRIGSGALHAGIEAARRDAERTLAMLVRLADRGRGLPVYEPEPGCVALYPDETPAFAGDPVVIPVLGTDFEVL